MPSSSPNFANVVNAATTAQTLSKSQKKRRRLKAAKARQNTTNSATTNASPSSSTASKLQRGVNTVIATNRLKKSPAGTLEKWGSASQTLLESLLQSYEQGSLELSDIEEAIMLEDAFKEHLASHHQAFEQEQEEALNKSFFATPIKAWNTAKSYIPGLPSLPSVPSFRDAQEYAYESTVKGTMVDPMTQDEQFEKLKELIEKVEANANVIQTMKEEGSLTKKEEHAIESSENSQDKLKALYTQKHGGVFSQMAGKSFSNLGSLVRKSPSAPSITTPAGSKPKASNPIPAALPAGDCLERLVSLNVRVDYAVGQSKDAERQEEERKQEEASKTLLGRTKTVASYACWGPKKMLTTKVGLATTATLSSAVGGAYLHNGWNGVSTLGNGVVDVAQNVGGPIATGAFNATAHATTHYLLPAANYGLQQGLNLTGQGLSMAGESILSGVYSAGESYMESSLVTQVAIPAAAITAGVVLTDNPVRRSVVESCSSLTNNIASFFGKKSVDASTTAAPTNNPTMGNTAP